jgi:2',3'-cyclic-nucleotide 2'-phosphodiesterase (5'-nucleotidase family)
MKRTSPLLALCAALLLSLAGCQPPRETEIVVLSLNDIHAHIDNLDKVAAYVSEQRATHPNVLLLVAGDLFSGNPIVDAYSSKGFPMIDLMNDLHVDISTLGNHEFDYGQATLAERMAQAQFPFVCANMHTSGSLVPQPAPCKVFTLDNGQTVAVVGLLQEYPDTHTGRLTNLQFDNPHSAAKRYIDSLRTLTNVLVALTHIGIHEDSLLAVQQGNIDLIVGGHTHTRLDSGRLVNGVLITQAERYVKFVGRTVITLRNGRVVGKRNQLVDVAQLAQRDTTLTRKIKNFYSTPEFSEVVATLDNPIADKLQIGNFFCDVLRQQIGADIMMQNEGGFRLDTLHKGDLTKFDLYGADPFGNEIIQLDMDASELQRFIHDNYQSRRGLDLCVSGLTYTIRTTPADEVLGVDLLLPNGHPLNPQKRYTIAMNSYMVANHFAYRIPNGDAGRGIGITPVEAIISYFAKHKEAARYRAETRGKIVKTEQ